MGRGERVVLAHGFTQNRGCWGPFGHDLASDHEVVAVDLPGHGTTAADHDEADLAASGELLADVGGEAVFVGYSMGGRVALHTALARPELVRGLVLVGVTAGIDESEARQVRVEADAALAERLDEIGLAAFLDRWLAGPLFAGLTPAGACLERRLTNRVDGLTASLRRCGTGTQEPLWDRLDRIDAPVLVLVGADDDKFTELGHRLVEQLPQARLQSLPACHAVHLEQPSGAASAVRRFIAELP